MTEPSPRERLRVAIKEELRNHVVPPIPPLKARGTSWTVSDKDRRKLAEVSFEFLARVDAVYLVCQVVGGRLADMVSAANLPAAARHSLAVGFYFKSSLSEKAPRFTSERGGAEYFSATTDVAELAEKLVSRAVEHYVPSIETILSMTPSLSTLILDEPQFFSFPLAALAILDQLGVDDTFSRIEGTKAAKVLSPKEAALDLRSWVGSRWEEIERVGGLE